MPFPSLHAISILSLNFCQFRAIQLGGYNIRETPISPMVSEYGTVYTTGCARNSFFALIFRAGLKPTYVTHK